MAEPFWKTKTLEEMSEAEWESLCDGCGKCCLAKLEDEDTGEIHWTSVACRLFNAKTCRCHDYENRLAQVSDHPLSLNQGTLYPALVRMEQKGWIKGAWGRTDSNREAKFYSLTRAGERALAEQAERWRRLAGLVDKLLLEN